jgi:hypothetical protein
MLAGLFGAGALHLAALMASPAAWGGVRHATPLIAMAAILGGGAVAEAWRRRSRALSAVVAALFVAAFAMTIREPRLWEYHNELVGGSAGAWRYFDNEGLNLGQRFGEIRAFHDRMIRPGGLPMYSNYWMMESQVRGAHLNFHRYVESLDDDNLAGLYDGWFVYSTSDRNPWPQYGWNPDEVFKGLALAARFGNVEIWRGRLLRPKSRASSLNGQVMDYIYKQDGKDWALVARKLEEVAAVLPNRIDAAVELGNAYLRMGDAARAARAYARPLQQRGMPIDAELARRLRAQVALAEAGGDPKKIEPMRNPWLE